MARLLPKDWGDFQHYKDRNPPWIRLHKGLLDNYEYQRLPVASRALAPMLWLLSSESKDLKTGAIEYSHEKIAFRLRMDVKELAEAVKPLIDGGFFFLDANDSSVLAEREQVAVPETETETETETEKPRVPRFDAQAHLESLGVTGKVAKDWLELRRKKRAPATETALEGIENEAKKAGWTMDAALRLACERGWQGFNAKWLTEAKARASPGQTWVDKNDATIAALTGRDRSYEPDDRTIDI